MIENILSRATYWRTVPVTFHGIRSRRSVTEYTPEDVFASLAKFQLCSRLSGKRLNWQMIGIQFPGVIRVAHKVLSPRM